MNGQLEFDVSPEPSLLRFRLDQIRLQLETLTEQVPSKLDQPCGCLGFKGDVGELARTVLAAKAVIDACRDLKDAAETALSDAMTQRQMIVDDMVLERRSGTVRKDWDHTAVASQVAARAAVDIETGELLLDPIDAQRVADEILATAGVSYWRVGELRARGIEPEKYCTEERGRPSVIIRAAS